MPRSFDKASDEAFRENSERFKANNYFREKAPFEALIKLSEKF